LFDLPVGAWARSASSRLAGFRRAVGRVDPQEDEHAMRRVGIAFIATLLAGGAVAGAGAVAGTAVALPPAPGDAICGAWEPRGGAGDGFRRLCIDGSLTWYEYR
jgi:hypothetical protein